MDKELRGVEGIWRKFAFTLLGSIAVLIAVFLFLVDPDSFRQKLSEFPPLLLVAAFLVVVSSWMVDSWRLKMLSLGLGAKIPWHMMLFTLMSGNFLTLATPFAAGGAPLVVYSLYRHGMTFGQATAVVAGGGIAAQLGLITVIGASLTFMAPYLAEIVGGVGPIYFFVLAYFVVVLTVITAAFQSHRLKAWLESYDIDAKASVSWFWRALNWVANVLEEFAVSFRLLVKRRWLYFFAAYLLAVAYFSMQFTVGFLLLSGFDIAADSRLFRYGISVLLSAVPFFTPMPGGTGAAEYAAYYVLGSWVQSELIGTFIVVWRFFMFYLPLLSGSVIFPFLLAYLRRKE